MMRSVDRWLQHLRRDLEIVSKVGLERVLGDVDAWPELRSDEASEMAHMLSQPRRSRLWSAAALAGLRPWSPVETFDVEADADGSHRDRWFFVNGILNDAAIARFYGQRIANRFGRAVRVVLNPTDGIALDFAECVFGRTFDFASAPSRRLFEELRDACTSDEVDRVVLLAHSQGAIIAANAIGRLVRACSSDEAWLDKLEVYTFGSAADDMQVCPRRSHRAGRPVPFVEHFANDGDFVAGLGVLRTELRLEGDVFHRPANGHLLSLHYLEHLDAFRCRHAVDRHPRLLLYRGGQRPDAPPPRTELRSSLKAR